ncbi:MAG TPA: chromosome segregation protein SMC, partial [Candidatus Avilachnospira avicola]|nr:chromosome segregation protein SMC [Candidatus Avilachnospira avicola]
FKNNSNLLGRQRELSELKQQTRSILEKIDALNEQLVNAEKEASRITSEIDDLKSQLSDISLEKNRLSLEIISEFRLKLSGISQKAGFVMENLERLISEIKSALIERDGMYENKRLSFDEIKAKEDETEILRLRKVELEKEITEAQSEALRLNSRKEELTASQKGFFSRKDELSSETLRLEKELIRLESSREKLQQHIDEKTEYIWTEYELTLSDAATYEDQGLGDEQELSKAISGLRRRIRELGDVNVNAIEEYREVSERFEFLTAQHDDLVASEASILSVIDELDKGMKRQFAERFAEIRKGFDGVFRELFGGGSGDLELQLTEEEDELSAGIAIIAQPPGKKLQNMMQLSGGEKALTAIALLFAIQAMKPSPFCLLDEIEAALDDSNIDRFAAYLSRLTDRTQFIVITHRRGTMESCDRLYGITMQEKGITALVSVDLVSDSLS